MSGEFQDRQSARDSEAELRRFEERDAFLEHHKIKVGRVTEGGKRATVQISHNKRHNGIDVEHSLLFDVPVLFPLSGLLFLGMEAQAGDECVVFFNDRSIDDFILDGNQTYNLQESRIHDLSDGMCWPVCISDAGLARLESDGVDLIDCFTDLAAQVRLLALAVTPQQPTIAADIQAIINKVNDAR